MTNETITGFFKDRSVLVTGATGFMGKILIEKLLRSCPDLKTIYILVRSKRGKSIQERLNEVQSLPVFERLHTERPGIFDSKVVGIEGDMFQPRLGLSKEDFTLLGETVSVVFHVAATVRFNEPLANAVTLNAMATKELIDLSLTMPKLVAFLHVSTAYCNCDRTEVNEIVYPPHADWKEVFSVVENTDTAALNILTKKYIGNLPNTYTFTKSLAEQIVWDHKDKIPVVIFRPSIVISTWKEPLAGWTDTLNGPVGILIGYGKGVIRTSISEASVIPDYMAVDIAIKAIIVATWYRVNRSDDLDRHIYNASSAAKGIPIKEMTKYAIEIGDSVPMSETLWHYSTHFTNSRFWFWFNVVFKQVLPAIFLDFFLKVSGRKPLLMEVHRKYYNAMLALSYFTLRSWKFHNEHFLAINENIPPEDKESFDYDFQNIDIGEYFKDCTLGARKYLMKDEVRPEMLSVARTRAKRLYWLDRSLKVLFWVGVFWLVFSSRYCQSYIEMLSEYLPPLQYLLIEYSGR